MTTSITPQQIGQVIVGELVVGNDVRDARDPGRLDDVVAGVAIGSAADVDRTVRAAVLGHTAGLTEDFFTSVTYDDEQSTIIVERVPRGVAAAIVPWHLPVVPALVRPERSWRP